MSGDTERCRMIGTDEQQGEKGLIFNACLKAQMNALSDQKKHFVYYLKLPHISQIGKKKQNGKIIYKWLQ